ncbi:helix-turn-helix domain-containing protein [Legionella jamestowniensis]|uniref:helix-turn-helix domain-containing protein n=1 Tax=Legionella jamestowniensis TaxID=455 RepID=UPI0008E4B930|nr:helix-turn-helix transcriptional regulator [Legionella jamestowniensis]SFM08387.1 hypothetical protein SAMN02746073_0338 [Legionella jamestowniensis DSM 19215]
MQNNPVLNNISSAEARGKRIRFIREHLLSLTREEFCLNSKFTVQSLKGWELAWGGGLSVPGAEKICKRAKELNIYCTESWLMHGIGRVATPLSKDLDMQEEDEAHIAKELLLFREIPHAIDTIIKDDGMIPFLYPGNYVGGIIVKNPETALGKECIVIVDDGEILVRILNPGCEQGRYNLTCINERSAFVKKEIRNVTIKYVAPIVWIRRIFREDPQE